MQVTQLNNQISVRMKELFNAQSIKYSSNILLIKTIAIPMRKTSG